MTSAFPTWRAMRATFDLIAARSTTASDCPSMAFQCASIRPPASPLSRRVSNYERQRGCHTPPVRLSRRARPAWLGTCMVQLIPRKVLFGNPERVSPRLSPDGTRLAWIAPSGGVLNVWFAPVSPRSGVDWSQAVVVTDDTDRGIRRFAWAHDNKHLLYLQDVGGDENWRLYDVDLATMRHRDLTPFDGVQTQIVAMERDFPTEVLIGLNKDNPQLHDVYRLNLGSGELTKEVDNPGFLGWVADSKLVVRGAFAPQPDGSLSALVRDSAADDWRELLAIPAEDALTTDPVAFSADGQSLLVVSSVGAETAKLVRIDLASGAEEVLAGDREADVSDVRIDPQTREPQIVVVLKDRSEYLVLDPSVADDLAAIRALHHGDPNFVSADDAEETWLFTFKARDGLVIHGYATFPPDGPRTGLPTVLNVHGGPWARDAWGYDAEAQWLANRGYLCLQVNFRGSTGYGKGFVNA